MTVSRALRLFAVSLALAALTVLLGPGDAQAKVKCGSILGPGGTYVLDRNLRCRSDKHVSNSQPRVGVLRLTGGATLNLNGHTVTCKPGDTDTSSPWASDRWGIVVRDSTVTNGTVRGCSFGVIASGSLVKGMILDGNGIGVILREKFGGSGNVIMGNTAMNSMVGFYVGPEIRGNTLIDNVAQDNEIGFDTETYVDATLTLIGNVALRNRYYGFRTADRPRLIGNRAEQNGEGFKTVEGRGEMTGNIAKNNVGAGFVVELERLDLVHDNVARGNGGDGFQVIRDVMRLVGTLSGNHAINNLGHGLHVVNRWGEEFEEPTGTITGNMAIRNGAGDLADDSDCRVALWVDNRFGTAAQPCIH
jgi:parallel beta-helix repeat protein